MGKALPPPPSRELVLDYVPRKQFVPFHERRQRHSVLVTHRRCGKTVASICDLIMRAVAHPGSKPAGRFAYIATILGQGAPNPAVWPAKKKAKSKKSKR